MELYSRYTDPEGRLIVVIGRRASFDAVPGKDGAVDILNFTPVSVELLSVHEEKAKLMAYEVFDKLVVKGTYKRVEKQ